MDTATPPVKETLEQRCERLEKMLASSIAGKPAARAVHIATKAELSQAIKLVLGVDMAVDASDMRTFSSGNTGWHASGKVMCNGVRYQAQVQLVALKPKA